MSVKHLRQNSVRGIAPLTEGQHNMHAERVVAVSLGIPVYNGARFIEASLESALSQTLEDFELIVSDNASTDNTVEICQKYAAQDSRIKILKGSSNVGIVRNYRRVQNAARGKYFKMLAADDLIAPTFLERCVETLEAEPRAILCTARMTPIDEHGQTLRTQGARNQYVTEYGETTKVVEPANALLQGAVVDRFREVVNNVNGNLMVQFCFGLARRSQLDAHPPLGLYLGAEKVALSQLALAGEWRYVPETLMHRRYHQGHFAYHDSRSRELGAARQFLGYAQSIWRAHLTPSEKARCAGVLTRYAVGTISLGRFASVPATDFGFFGRRRRRV